MAAANAINHARSKRRPDLDALRVLATGAVFLFHCGKFFDPGGWHLTNAPASPAVGRIIDLTSLWLMPLFFVVSGTSTGIALANRSALKLLTDRVLRLLLPFAFGVIVIVPPQVWAERVGHGAFAGSYVKFYPQYFDGMYGFGGNFAWMGLHLWYLGLLFLITLLLGPILRSLATRIVDSPAVLLVPLMVMAVIEVALIGHALDRRDLGGWSIVQYPLFFASGVVLSSQAKARSVLRRFAVPFLVLGALAGAAWALAPDAVIALAPRAVWRVVRASGAWGLLYGMLGLAERHVRDAKWIARFNEASMPFYVLHQTAIVLIALSLLQWNVPITLKYVVLAVTAFGVTALLTTLVLRGGYVRPLFGLRRATGSIR